MLHLGLLVPGKRSGGREVVTAAVETSRFAWRVGTRRCFFSWFFSWCKL